MIATLFVALTATSGSSEEYAALNGVKGVKAVFDVSLESPKVANAVFWAVKNVYEDESVRPLSEPPKVAVVFRGPAVSEQRNAYENKNYRTFWHQTPHHSRWDALCRFR